MPASGLSHQALAEAVAAVIRDGLVLFCKHLFQIFLHKKHLCA